MIFDTELRQKDARRKLYETTREELQKMVEMGGRDSEKDLLDKWGGYKRKMHSKVVDGPCPSCKTPIIKEQYGGGSIYYCPTCQKLN